MALTKVLLIHMTCQQTILIPCSCDCHIISLLVTMILVAEIVTNLGPFYISQHISLLSV